jgi:predicted amidohydrolase
MFTLHSGHFDESYLKRLRRVLTVAKDQVGRIDGVVLPELALTNSTHRQVKNAVLDNGSFLISGVGSPSIGKKVGTNCVALDIPIVGLDFQTNIRQSKHHRWKLTKSQIVQYGLSTHLNPAASWWEHISIAERRLVFVAMRPWLALSVLVCEDLARPDPAGDIVRAVGPNLVVSILADGPQLTDRWSARYATVLADDPGCSVLCLTSAGMAELSKPRPGGMSRSHVVALWKDAERGLIEIELPTGADAIVLNISVDYKEEWSIDGRSDGGFTGYPILSGVHYVSAGTQEEVDKYKFPPRKHMTALSPIEASTLSLLARNRGMSKKQYRDLLSEVELSLQARRIAAELYEGGRSRSKKKRTRIARKTAREIRGWAEVNQRLARQVPRARYERPISSYDRE